MLKNKKLYSLLFIVAVGIFGTFPLYAPDSEKAKANLVFGLNEEILGIHVIEKAVLLPLTPPPFPEVAKKIDVITTAYSSSIWETQGDPFITASGKHVRDGIVANNLLAFGTKIRLPELFGDKVFVVEDRMHWRKGNEQVDIWFPSRQGALEFGAKLTCMEIIAN